GTAICIDARIAYGVAIVAALCLPETRGRNLESTPVAVEPLDGGTAR
ncbi:MFS transporter, partial [Pseudomonas syringae pv. tagetis]